MKVYILLACIFGVTYGAILGSYRPHDVNDPTVATMANFAMGELGKQNALLKTANMRIVHVKQVVSGMNYRITMEVDDGHYKQLCTVDVYDQPLTSIRTLTSSECHNSKRPVSVVGKPVKRSVAGNGESTSDDVHMKKLVPLAVNYINANSESLYWFSRQKVENVKQKAVAGVVYNFDLTVGQTNCRKSELKTGSDMSACLVTTNSRMKTYHVKGTYFSRQNPQHKINFATELCCCLRYNYPLATGDSTLTGVCLKDFHRPLKVAVT